MNRCGLSLTSDPGAPDDIRYERVIARNFDYLRVMPTSIQLEAEQGPSNGMTVPWETLDTHWLPKEPGNCAVRSRESGNQAGNSCDPNKDFVHGLLAPVGDGSCGTSILPRQDRVPEQQEAA